MILIERKSWRDLHCLHPNINVYLIEFNVVSVIAKTADTPVHLQTTRHGLQKPPITLQPPISCRTLLGLAPGFTFVLFMSRWNSKQHCILQAPPCDRSARYLVRKNYSSSPDPAAGRLSRYSFNIQRHTPNAPKDMRHWSPTDSYKSFSEDLQWKRCRCNILGWLWTVYTLC